jgi:hypothetical protein
MTLAMIYLYSEPDKTLLEASYGTLRSSSYHGNQSIAVIDVKMIEAVVAMVPHFPYGNNIQQYFVVEKPGLAVAHLGGVTETVPDDE